MTTGAAGWRDRVRNRAWLILLFGGIAATGVYELLPVDLTSELLYAGVGLVSAFAIPVGVRLHRPRLRLPWYLMGAGQLIWSVADASGAWSSEVLGLDTFPGIADVFYLIAYPVIIAGAWRLVRARQPRHDLGGVLDSLTLTAGLALLSWVLLAQPTLMQYQDSPLGAAVAVAYPVLDIVLLGLGVRLLTIPLKRNRSLRLLLAAMISLIAADSLASTLSLLAFNSTRPIDFLWLVSYVAWGCSALHPSMKDLSLQAPAMEATFARTRLLALLVAVLIAPGVLAAEKLVDRPLNVWAVVVGSVVMFGLVMARTGLGIGQILRANRERAEAQEELARQAAHDSLTGLPNRAQARRLITGALSRAQRSGALIGLLFIDLDGFKLVNDALGHGAGDEVLTAVAVRMQGAVRDGDVVARQGGDEFLVLLEPLDEQSSAVLVAQRLIEAISAPITLNSGRKTWVGASVGVALSQDAGTDPEVLLIEADVAVYRAKDAGRGRIEVFDEALRRELAERNALEAGVAAAIRNDELVLHYQPIVGVRSGEIEGWEALVRWHRPGVGLLQPADFVPVAERSDLICELDSWVLQEATRQLVAWSALPPGTVGHAPEETVMNVGLSARHAARSRVSDDVALALAQAGLDPRRLVLEVSETALLSDSTASVNLGELRDLGVQVTMADFGTQYSSIARLEHLPVDAVKIDRSFLYAAGESNRLLPLIIEAAHAFALPVVAEGVDDAEQLAALRASGCESAQGRLLGGPVSPEMRQQAQLAVPRSS